MRKTVLFILAVIFQKISCGQYLWQMYTDTVVQWNYYNGDEFNGESIDADKWYTRLPWGRSVVSQDIYYLDSNTQVANGSVNFALKKESRYYPISDWELETERVKERPEAIRNRNEYRFDYSGGLIWSKQEYKYGYFEIKFKADEGQGAWPAFWLYGGKPNNEIDFYELKGEKRNALHVDIHCPDGCANYTTGWFGYRKSFGYWIKTKQAVLGEYNIMSGEWTPQWVKWYLNGQLIAYSRKSIDIPMNLTTGTGVARTNGPFGPGPDKETVFPNIVSIDYIRVFRSDTALNISELSKAISEEKKPVESTRTYTNTAKKTVTKGERGITISAMPISREQIQVRILGMTKQDAGSVTITSASGEMIDNRKITDNIEYAVSVKDISLVQFEAMFNGRQVKALLGDHRGIRK